jgi:hypothetical protein
MLSKINWTPCTTLVGLFASTDNLNPMEATESYDQCMPILISECVDLDLHAFCFFDFYSVSSSITFSLFLKTWLSL